MVNTLKKKRTAYISRQWLDLFKYDFIAGSPAAFFQQPFSLLLTESTAKRYFGDQPAVGQFLRIDTINYQVQAIVKDNPTNSSFQYDILMPIQAMHANPDQRKNDEQWGNFNYVTFIRLRPGANNTQVIQKLNNILDKNRKENKVYTSLMPLAQLHFDKEVDSSSFAVGNRQSVYIFAILGILLLVVACINYVNLTTARASLRSKEVSIRKIVGAPRASLFGQFVIESILTSALALLLTIAFVQLSLPFFNRLTEIPFTLPITSASFWLLIFGTLAAATLLTGIYPALLLSSFKPIALFKGNSILKLKDVTLRKILVVTQFSISVILIAATLIIYRQLNYIQQQSTGYDRSQILSFSLPYKTLKPFGFDTEKIKSFQYAIKQDLQSISGVEHVSFASASVLNISSTSAGSADWEGRPKDFAPSIARLSADEDYAPLFGLQLVAGRWFHPHDPTDENNNFILNETAVKDLNIRKPYIGQRFKLNGDSGQIVGIMKDFHFRSLHEAVIPLALHTGGNGRNQYFVKIAPANIGRVLPQLEKYGRKQ
ncbi:ABC transporter permease [Paraflavitalea speifideaquila]|uniref:ABC transporter permease n=1 Tax=Paraflavitalea speifideaquila TaxID=3076558 RepID=UPI0028E7DFF0|nr:ABC transporter permease [Paraflavitalea speifideiaquila]